MASPSAITFCLVLAAIGDPAFSGRINQRAPQAGGLAYPSRELQHRWLFEDGTPRKLVDGPRHALFTYLDLDVSAGPRLFEMLVKLPGQTLDNVWYGHYMPLVERYYRSIFGRADAGSFQELGRAEKTHAVAQKIADAFADEEVWDVFGKRSDITLVDKIAVRIRRDHHGAAFVRECARLLSLNPAERPTAAELLEHPFLNWQKVANEKAPEGPPEASAQIGMRSEPAAPDVGPGTTTTTTTTTSSSRAEAALGSLPLALVALAAAAGRRHG